MPATLKEHLESISTAPMAEYYDAEGVTPEILAKKGKELLGAITPKTYKLKGWFDRTAPMPDGWRVIKGTTQETLLEQLLSNDGIRLRSLVEISKQLGLYPSEKVDVTHSLDRLVAEVVRDILGDSKGLPPLPSDEDSE